ncbi:M50 family metallopeptidase [Nitrospinota bacterium]
MGFYALWHRIRPPEFLYTFAHEMTHLLFGLLFGKKVSRFIVSRQSGQVAMSGTNFLITLAPYFFPLLAAIVLAAGAVAEWGIGDARFRPWVSFMTGLALAFHVTMTFRTLATSQPDIERGGKLFSWSMIYLIGVLFAGGAAFAAAGGGRGVGLLSGEFLSESLRAYVWSGDRIMEGVRTGIALAMKK